MPVAYSYVRFSSRRQALGNSRERQLEQSRAWAEREGYHLDETFRLNDLGVSAFKGANARLGALSHFLGAIKDGRIAPGSVFLVESLDRLSREKISAARDTFEKIVKAGVDIVTFSPERRYTRASLDDIVGLLEPAIIFARANEESEIKAHRARSVWAKHRSRLRNKPGTVNRHIPWWLKKVDGGYEPIPERVAMLNRIFEMKAAGHGTPGIVKALNTDPSTPRPVRARQWNHNTIGFYLRSRLVLGEYQPCLEVDGKEVPEGDPIPDHYPQVITPDLFHRAQAAFRAPTSGRSTPLGDQNIFKGLLYNGWDSSPIYQYGVVAHKKVKVKGETVKKVYTYRDLVSHAAHCSTPDADRSRMPYEKFERGFLVSLRELKPGDFVKVDHDLAESIASHAGRLGELEHSITATKAKIRAAKPGTEGVFLELLGEIDSERRATEETLMALRDRAASHEAGTVEGLQSVAEMLASAPDDEAKNDFRVKVRSRLGQLVKRITAWPIMGANHGSKGGRDWDCFVEVQFHVGSRRTFLLDHTGSCQGGAVLVGSTLLNLGGRHDEPEAEYLERRGKILAGLAAGKPGVEAKLSRMMAGQ